MTASWSSFETKPNPARLAHPVLEKEKFQLQRVSLQPASVGLEQTVFIFLMIFPERPVRPWRMNYFMLLAFRGMPIVMIAARKHFPEMGMIANSRLMEILLILWAAGNIRPSLTRVLKS